MVRVDGPYCGVDAVVERDEPAVLRVGWLVHGVVARYPLALVYNPMNNSALPLFSVLGIAHLLILVMLGNLAPQPDESILEVLVNPEVRDVRAGV